MSGPQSGPGAMGHLAALSPQSPKSGVLPSRSTTPTTEPLSFECRAGEPGLWAFPSCSRFQKKKKNGQPIWSPSTSEFLSRGSWDSSLGIKSSRGSAKYLCNHPHLAENWKLRAREHRVVPAPTLCLPGPSSSSSDVPEQIRTGVRGRARPEPERQ